MDTLGIIMAEIERRLAKYDEHYTSAGKELNDLRFFIKDLMKQEEFPMPNSTELIEMWDAEREMLKEKDLRGDTWRIAQNAFMDGFARGTCVKFEKQKERKPNIEICPHSIKSKSYKENGYPIIEAVRKAEEQMPTEWSEEDEKRLNAVVELLENTSAIHPNYSHRKLIIWLKSLRPS